jgi:hypothetical protein
MASDRRRHCAPHARTHAAVCVRRCMRARRRNWAPAARPPPAPDAAGSSVGSGLHMNVIQITIGIFYKAPVSLSKSHHPGTVRVPNHRVTGSPVLYEQVPSTQTTRYCQYFSQVAFDASMMAHGCFFSLVWHLNFGALMILIKEVTTGSHDQCWCNGWEVTTRVLPW